MKSEIHRQPTLPRLVWGQKFRKLTAGIVAADCLAVLTGCALPLFQKYLIDGATSGNRRIIWGALFILAALTVAGAFLRTLARLGRGRLSIRCRNELQSKIFKHIMLLPEDFLQSRGAGYFFNRIQHDIAEVTLFIAHGGLVCYPEILKLLLAMAAISILDWRYALFILPFFAVQAWLCLLFRPRQFRLARKIQEKTANERHTMQELITSHRLIKTHNSNDEAQQRIDKGLSGLTRLIHRKQDHDNLLQLLLQLPVWLCGGMIVLAGMLEVADKTTTLGQVWALLGLLMLAFAPVRMLGSIFAQAQAAEAAWLRMRELWAENTEHCYSKNDSIRLTGDIAFNGVSFSYSPEKVLIENLSLYVPANSGIFITGANGSGKSTLLSLLLRLFEVRSGSISIGGIPIRQTELSAYRSRIGYIGQQPEFFKGTLRENLSMGNPACTDEKIIDMFNELQFESLLAQLPHGLETPVMEQGENFSGGEKLRLALIRELLRDTDLLLFDEPAANLDRAGRQQFYALLQKLPAQKTVFAVVHDLPENCRWPVIDLSSPGAEQ